MRLRNRQSYITTLPEGEPTKKQAPKVTRWIYFFVLFSLVGYLAYIGYTRLTQFQGRGQVEVEKTVISPSHGGQIIGLFVAEGDLVQQGSTIARIEASTGCQLGNTSRFDKLSLDIQLKKSQLNLLNKRLTEEKKSLNDQEVRRALEIDRRLSKDITSDLYYKVEALKAEILLAGDALQKFKLGSTTANNSNCQDETIRTPFTAKVNSISHKQYEFSRRGEPLITLIRENSLVRVEAFIANKSSQHVSVGKEIEVVFPDGQSSQGVVSEIISSSAPFPTKEWNKYESAESNIRIHISPENKIEAQKWRLYDRMEVQVRGLK